MSKKQRAVVFAEGGKKNTFVISGPDPVEEARSLVRSVGGTYYLEGFTAAEKAAIAGGPMSKPYARAPKEGTRVVFRPSGASLALYSHPPQVGESGTVTSVASGRGKKRTFMPGPGGGLLYVRWDDSRFVGVSLADVRPEPTSARRVKGNALRKGNPSHEDEEEGHEHKERDQARAALSQAFGSPTGYNADWMEMAWFVQGTGGKVNPNRPDLHHGLHATKSIWVAEQPEDNEYCVILRLIDEDAGETEDEALTCVPAAEVERVIEAAMEHAAEVFGRKEARKGNPFQSSREYAGLSYAHLVSKQDALARRTGCMPWPRLNGIPMSPAQIMVREIRETRRRMGPAATLLQAAHRVAENHPTIAHEALDGMEGAQEPELAALKSVWPGIRRSNPVKKSKGHVKQKQFGSSVTPALENLVRDVTGKACYQETCFIDDSGRAPRRPRG